GLLLCAGGLTLSLVDVLAVVIAGLALVTLGHFSAVTAAQLGVAGSTDRDRGLASAVYYSSYYVAGALGSYLPGLAWESGGWSGVWALDVAAYLIALTALVAAATRPRAQPGASTTPGLRIPCGSSARLIARIACSSPSA